MQDAFIPGCLAFAFAFLPVMAAYAAIEVDAVPRASASKGNECNFFWSLDLLFVSGGSLSAVYGFNTTRALRTVR